MLSSGNSSRTGTVRRRADDDRDAHHRGPVDDVTFKKFKKIGIVLAIVRLSWNVTKTRKDGEPMLRKTFGQKRRAYQPIVAVEVRFAVGDRVHALHGGEIGTIEFCRKDGFCCIQWPCGTREWLSQDGLCGPLVH